MTSNTSRDNPLKTSAWWPRHLESYSRPGLVSMPRELPTDWSWPAPTLANVYVAEPFNIWTIRKGVGGTNFSTVDTFQSSGLSTAQSVFAHPTAGIFAAGYGTAVARNSSSQAWMVRRSLDGGATWTNAAGGICIRTLSLTATLPPPILSNPLAQTNGQFSFTLLSPAGSTVEIQGSTNLLSWTTLATLINLTGMLPFTDTATSINPRFYRVALLP